MTEPTTRVERLLTADRPAPLGAAVRDAHKASLRAMITADAPATAQPQAPTRRRWRWGRRGTALIVGGLLAATGGAAAAFLTRALPDDPTIVRCFSVAAPPFTAGAPGTIEAAYGTGDGSLDQTAQVAIDLCADAWARGRLPRTDDHAPADTGDGQATHPVPDLQACILPDGIVGVLPGDENTCTRLGLPTSAA